MRPSIRSFGHIVAAVGVVVVVVAVAADLPRNFASNASAIFQHIPPSCSLSPWSTRPSDVSQLASCDIVETGSVEFVVRARRETAL